jgi:hypothetical protein
MHQPYYRYILPSVGLFGNVVPRRVALIYGERAGLWEAFWPATFAYHVARDPSLCDRRNSFGGFILCFLLKHKTNAMPNMPYVCYMMNQAGTLSKYFFQRKDSLLIL